MSQPLSRHLVRLLIVGVAGVAAGVGCGRSGAPGKDMNAEVEHLQGWTGATANFAPNPAPGEWPSQGRDYAHTRYSPLDQVTPDNVAELKIAWTFSDGTNYGHEGSPLVKDDTMYVVTPFPNIAYALDLTKPGVPIKWSFAPQPSPMAIGKACCDAVLRGWALADGKLIYNLLDAHTVAVDAQTGEEVWRTKMDDVERGATMTSPAEVYGDKVFVGNSGGELGVWGWLAALDVKTGKEVWRAYNTGPDEAVKIGADFAPFYDWMKGKDLGAKSWPGEMWKQGGAASWGWVSYDPDLDLIYYGTANPSPRVPAQRPGLNLWSAALWARDADTGMAKWAYQFTPHDEWDYDGVNENVLIDVPFKGQTRHALVQFNRNGYAYTIDRQTGEVLVAAPFGHFNWSTGFDLNKGLPIVNPAMHPQPEVELKNVCPTDIGVKDWQPAAFSPRTGLLYTGIFNICMDLTNHRQSYIAGTPYDGMEMKRHAGPGGNWGAFIAWDPVNGRKVWEIPEKFITMSGALTTGSDLVFYGTADGWFRAVDARTGKVLWSQKLGSGIVSSPIAYVGPDGQEYIAIYAGVGGAAMVQSGTPGFPPRGNTLYVFSLGGDLSGGPGMKETEVDGAPPSPPPQHNVAAAPRATETAG